MSAFDPGKAVLAAWGSGILTALRAAKAGQDTDDLETAAKNAIAAATRKGPPQCSRIKNALTDRNP